MARASGLAVCDQTPLRAGQWLVSEQEGDSDMNMVKRARMAGTAVVVAGLLTAAGSQAALGAEPGFGSLFLNGQVVGTVVPPAQVSPGSGLDPFYKVTNAVGGQLGIAGVGPRSEEHTSELQSRLHLVCRLLLE